MPKNQHEHSNTLENPKVSILKYSDDIFLLLAGCGGIGCMVVFTGITLEHLIKQGDVGWWASFCGLPTTVLSYLTYRGIRAIRTSYQEDLASSISLQEKHIHTSSGYFVFHNTGGIQLPIETQQVISYDLTPNEPVETKKTLELKLHANRSDELTLVMYGADHPYISFQWGNLSYQSPQTKNTTHEQINFGLSLFMSNFERIEKHNGKQYLRYQKTALHFSTDLRKLYILRNGKYLLITSFEDQSSQTSQEIRPHQ